MADLRTAQSRATGANLRVAAAALLLLLASDAVSDLIPAHQGFGYDGFRYGYWVQSLSLEVLAAPRREPPEVAVTSYTVRRLAPSIVLHYTMRALGIERSVPNVVRAFQLLNILMLTLGVYWWCRAADELEVREPGKWLGGIALIISYMNLKMPVFYPALTDSTAFGLGAAMLLLHVRRRPGWVLALSAVGAFVWPTFFYFGALLAAFPRDPDQPDRPAPPGFAVGAAAAVACGGAGYALYLLVTGYTIRVTPVEPLRTLAPLSLAITGAFLFLALRPLLDSSALLRDLHPLRVARRPWPWATLLVFGGIQLVLASIDVQRSRIGMARAISDNFFTSVTQPGIFLLAHVLLYGPVLLALPRLWPRMVETIRRNGTGLVLFFVLVVVLAAGSESRKLINVYPLVVLFLVAAAEPLFASWRRLTALALLSLAFSKVWLPMSHPVTLPGLGEVDWITLFRSARGPWIDHPSYVGQLVIVVAVGALVWHWCGNAPGRTRAAAS